MDIKLLGEEKLINNIILVKEKSWAKVELMDKIKNKNVYHKEILRKNTIEKSLLHIFIKCWD